MKYEFETKEFRAALCCGNRRNIKLHISRGKKHTNPIADQIDTLSGYHVLGTAFQKECSSIVFSADKSKTWEEISDSVRKSIRQVIGWEEPMDIHIISHQQASA
ncbi:MAG: hypothetical protein NC311_13160 [Muribaculaceae bacterium]|nr:hypothetical protein [Muribaculaceae bacterium]